MESRRSIQSDWRDGAAYAGLLGADRSLFAWEWLRRDSRYREACEQAFSTSSPADAEMSPAAFGLVAFEHADRAVPHARPLWRSDITSYVLEGRPGVSAGAEDDLDLEPLEHLATIVISGEAEHLLLSDGLRCIRLDVPRGTFAGRRASLRYCIGGLRSAKAPLLVLRRLVALCERGEFSPPLSASNVRRQRIQRRARASGG